MNLFTLLDQTAIRLPTNGAVYLGTKQLLTFVELRKRALPHLPTFALDPAHLAILQAKLASADEDDVSNTLASSYSTNAYPSS